LVAIPIAVFMIIHAGTASSSPFQRTPKIDHHHAGIVFTFRWNTRSQCAGNREHHAPEYAGCPNVCGNPANKFEAGGQQCAAGAGQKVAVCLQLSAFQFLRRPREGSHSFTLLLEK